MHVRALVKLNTADIMRYYPATQRRKLPSRVPAKKSFLRVPQDEDDKPVREMKARWPRGSHPDVHRLVFRAAGVPGSSLAPPWLSAELGFFFFFFFFFFY